MRRSIFSALLVATFVLVAAESLAGSANDAGLGIDASNSAATPTPLPRFGSYAGSLADDDPADWYGVATPSEPACYQLNASGNTGISVTLGVRGTGFDHAVAETLSTNASTPSRLVIASSGTTQAYAGFVAQSSFSGWPRPYTFTLTRAQAVAGESSLLPTPAGLLANPVPLPGSCVSGHLNPLAGAGHTTDAYSINATAGDQIVYSLASLVPAVQLSIVDTNGKMAGPTISSNGIATTTFPTSGTYFVLAQGAGTSAIDYTIALIGDPVGSPCRPSCTLSGT